MSDSLKWLYYHLQRFSFPCLADPDVSIFKELFELEGRGFRKKRRKWTLAKKFRVHRKKSYVIRQKRIWAKYRQIF